MKWEYEQGIYDLAHDGDNPMPTWYLRKTINRIHIFSDDYAKKNEGLVPFEILMFQVNGEIAQQQLDLAIDDGARYEDLYKEYAEQFHLSALKEELDKRVLLKIT